MKKEPQIADINDKSEYQFFESENHATLHFIDMLIETYGNTLDLSKYNYFHRYLQAYKDRYGSHILDLAKLRAEFEQAGK